MVIGNPNKENADESVSKVTHSNGVNGNFIKLFQLQYGVHASATRPLKKQIEILLFATTAYVTNRVHVTNCIKEQNKAKYLTHCVYTTKYIKQT